MLTPIYKKPLAEQDYTFDFSDRIKSTDNIKPAGEFSETAVIVYDSTDADKTSVVVASHDVSSTNRDQYVVRLQAGTEGEDYRVLCTVEADVSGDVWVDEVELRMRARIG